MEGNRQNQWFRGRTSLSLESCALVSTAWLFGQYLAYCDENAVENITHYKSTSGHQKAFTLFIRHVGAPLLPFKCMMQRCKPFTAAMAEWATPAWSPS